MAVLVYGIDARRLIRLNPWNGRGNNSVGNRDTGEEADLVDGSVRFKFFVGENTVVDANRLDRSVQIPLYEIIRITGFIDTADIVGPGTNRTCVILRATEISRNRVEHDRIRIAVESRHVTTTPSARFHAARLAVCLEVDRTSCVVGVEITLVVRRTKKRGIRRSLRTGSHIADDLDGEDVANVDVSLQPAVVAIPDRITIRCPFACDVVAGRVTEHRDVGAGGEVHPHRCRVIVRFEHTDIANTIQLENQPVHCIGVRLVQHLRIRSRRRKTAHNENRHRFPSIRHNPFIHRDSFLCQPETHSPNADTSNHK